jgi:HEAT repeat protein
MLSVSNLSDLIGPAGLLIEALLASLFAVLCLLVFILLRRTIRRLHFRRRDRRVIEIRSQWEGIVTGAICPKSWMLDGMSREVVEGILLDRLEVAPPDETEKLRGCLRFSGLLDARIHEAGNWKNWRRDQALLALGRMGVPESIRVLSEALDDAAEETRIAAVRGLGRLGLCGAAVPILERLSAGKLDVPPAVSQDALINNCRSASGLVLTFLSKSVKEARPLLSRVLGEIATPALGNDLLLLSCDESAEVRASVARALATAKPRLALSTLAGLAKDEEWFVRLRAVVALGELLDPRSIPILVEALSDCKRQVRMRAACALSRLKGYEEHIFYLTMGTQDPNALEELVSELERSGTIHELVTALGDTRRKPMAEAALLAALEGGCRRILLDLVLHHDNWRVRGALARLLARSKDTTLAGMIEMFESPHLPPRKRRVLRWLARELVLTETSFSSEVEVMA